MKVHQIDSWGGMFILWGQNQQISLILFKFRRKKGGLSEAYEIFTGHDRDARILLLPSWVV